MHVKDVSRDAIRRAILVHLGEHIVQLVLALLRLFQLGV